MDYKEKLAYLLKRLVSIKCDECRDAVVLVENAIQNGSEFPRPDEEIALYHPVWGCITRALDVPGKLTIEEQLMLDAMEAEMAGHVLTARQAKGELVYRIETTAATHSEGHGSVNIKMIWQVMRHGMKATSSQVLAFFLISLVFVFVVGSVFSIFAALMYIWGLAGGNETYAKSEFLIVYGRYGIVVLIVLALYGIFQAGKKVMREQQQQSN